MITKTEQTREVLQGLDPDTLDYLVSNIDDVYKVLNDMLDEQVYTTTNAE